MSNTPPTITLHPGKEQSILRFHPWIFSGAIKTKTGACTDGTLVEVKDSKGHFLAFGHYQEGTIAVRVCSFKNTAIDSRFWKNKLLRAFNLRKKLGLTDNPKTNVYRLVFGEGDGLPGLIMDYYNGTIVIQCHSYGMYLIREELCNALKEIYGESLHAVYDKSAETLPKSSPLNPQNNYLFGTAPTHEIVENGNRFQVDWETGQKTGFFVDQRESRKLLADFCKDKLVLNTFCYTGGFSVSALAAGAKEVHSVDSSKKAITLTDQNIKLNAFPKSCHQSFAADTFDFLKGKDKIYDVIVLDPPAFAKHQKDKHNAISGYVRLNAEALKQIKPGGILFTFSCSQAVDRQLFRGAIMAASIESGRSIRIIHQLNQPGDHPVSIFHPEGEYLKGLVLYVE